MVDIAQMRWFILFIFTMLPMKTWSVCTSGSVSCAFYSPYDQVTERILFKLESAKKSITILTDEIDWTIFKGVVEKKLQQGIQVELLVDYRKSFGISLEQNVDLSDLLKRYSNFKTLKLPVMRGAQAQMHNRFIVLDQNELLLFSAPFTIVELIANYNNALEIKDANVVAKYIAEVEELKKIAVAFCEAFNKHGKCTEEISDVNSIIHQYLIDGAFQKTDLTITTNSLCYSLQTKDAPEDNEEREHRSGILNELNRPSFDDIYKCFNDERLQAQVKLFLTKIASAESLAGEQQGDEFKIYFSPEDNILIPVLEELKKTLLKPKQSFVYISTNFITHPKLAITLQELKNAGVKISLTFDRNYFTNDDFKSQLNTLSPLGFYGDPNLINTTLAGVGARNPFHPSDFKNAITLFDNRLLDNGAKNSNNWIVVGAEKDLTLLVTSTEWSQNSLRLNDDNLLITKNPDLIAIYLKETLSQLYTYRYMQNINSGQFKEEIKYFSERSNCLNMLLGIDASCGEWSVAKSAPIVFSLQNVPANSQKNKVYLFSSQLNSNMGGKVALIPLTNRWVGVMAAETSWWYSYHFYIDGLTRDFNRNIEASALNLPRIETSLIWAR
jgi:phosphatidylserine/phosphatidylglycerophosphate/cardiolipin synthase-like enzyme